MFIQSKHHYAIRPESESRLTGANDRYHVVPEAEHNELIGQAFLARGYTTDEVADIVKECADAARYGVRTHHGLKALHLDHVFGSSKGGCIPGARIEKIQNRFKAVEVWNANRKAGPTVAYAAINRCIELANEFGVGMVNVDNAFHYFWGGAYVLEAARKGYIGYTQCTALLAEVVPFGGRSPSLGTNPHTWAFPTEPVIGFPILVDFATSSIAMGRVQQLLREGKELIEGCAVDALGNMTRDPAQVAALLPFGAHKGYGLGLVNELFAAYIGGFLPTLRGRPESLPAKNTTAFQFVVYHPEALGSGDYADGRSCNGNVKAVISDILQKNRGARLPGEIEAQNAAMALEAGGLLFTEAEMKAFGEIAASLGIGWQIDRYRIVEKLQNNDLRRHQRGGYLSSTY